VKLAIVTLGIDIEQLLQWSRPLFKQYAEKVGAELVIIPTRSINHPICPMLEKYQLYNVLENYDRVAFFDTDILIAPKTPDLFKIVPFEKIGAVYDCRDNNEHNRNHDADVKGFQARFGDVGWKDGYINSGVIVLSNIHRPVYQYDPRLHEINRRAFLEQGFTNYNIKKNKFQIHKLDRNFNRIAFGGKEQEYYQDGKLADIVHFAGRVDKKGLMEKFFHIMSKE